MTLADQSLSIYRSSSFVKHPGALTLGSDAGLTMFSCPKDLDCLPVFFVSWPPCVSFMSRVSRRQKRWALRRWTHVTTADRAAQGATGRHWATSET